MSKKHLIIYSCIISILLACLAIWRCGEDTHDNIEQVSSIDTIPAMVTQIRNCSRLYTAEIKVHKIITHDDDMKLSGKIMGKDVSINLPTGKRKIAIPMYATIKASIDLSTVTEENVIRHGDKIEVILPAPKPIITETHIDHDGIRQYVALTRSRFSDEELQNYEKQGRNAIEKDIPNIGIEAMAKESAARQVIPIIQAMGYDEKNITITFRKDVKNNTIFRKNE